MDLGLGLSITNSIVQYRFSPHRIAGLGLWLDASAITGLNNNDPVTTWSDQSGFNNDASQPTGANKPLFKTNVINTLPAILFDGIDDYMDINVLSFLDTACSVFIVSSASSATTSWMNNFTHSDASGTTDFFQFGIEVTTGSAVMDIESGVFVKEGSGYHDDLWHIWTGQKDASNSIDHFSIDNGTPVTNAATTILSNTDSTVVGAIKFNSTIVQCWNGYISEIIAYDNEISALERGLIMSYLSNKYNITIS